MANQNPEREFNDGFAVSGDTPEGHRSWSGAVEAMVRNLKIIKIWAWMNENDPESVHVLANYENLEKALQVMDDEDQAEASLRKNVFKALEVRDRAIIEVKDKNLVSILGKKYDEKLVEVEHDGKTKLLDEWLIELSSNVDPNHDLVEKLEKQIGVVFEKVRPGELRGIEDGRALSAIEDKLEYLKQLREIKEAKAQGKLTGRKTAVGRNHEKDIKNQELWRVKRADDTTRTQLETLSTNVREEAKDTLDEGHVRGLSEVELIKRWDHVNELRDNITSLLEVNTPTEDAERLRVMLISIQTQYEIAMANKMVAGWKKNNRSDEWSGDVARLGVKEYLEKRTRGWSVRVKLKGSDEKEWWNRVQAGSEKESEKIVKKLRDVGVKTNITTEDGQYGPNAQEFAAMKQFKATEDELVRILGRNNKYNLFEDTEFWSDLASGDKGIEKIIKRANPQDKDGLKKILEKMRQGKEIPDLESLLRPDYGMNMKDGDVNHADIAKRLNELIKNKRYGAAANLMLEYTTKVGIRESNQDLQFMMIRRNFLEEIANESSDFKEQFEMNQMLGYLPSLSQQKPEEFYGSYLRLHSKGNLDIIEGDNAMMGGNRVEYDGKTTTFSVKTFKAILRNPRYMVRVLNADPNTMDSTLQGIMLEEMYGRGTKMKVKNGKLFLALPGQEDEKNWRSFEEIKVNMRFADLNISGFNGWSEHDIEKEISLGEMLNRNQWILRDGMTMMWYSEDWKQVIEAKSYQTAVLQAAPKALLTSTVAKAAYQESFENIASPMVEAFEILTASMIPGMSVYKAADMVGKNIERHMWKELGNDDMDIGVAREMQGKFEKIGKIFTDLHMRSRIVDVGGGVKEKFKGRMRMNDTARLVFNDWDENDVRVVQMLRDRFEDRNMKRIPTENQLQEYYRRWKEGGGEGHLPKPIKKTDGMMETRDDLKQIAYFGQEYSTLWQEINELKMDKEARKTWNDMSFEELQVLWKMNDKMSGKPQERNLVVTPPQTEAQALLEYKEQFLREMYIDAFVTRTFTTNGDDHEQAAIKYFPARDEAFNHLMKICNVTGPLTDLEGLADKIQLFLPAEERFATIALLENRLNRATSENKVASYTIPLTESRHHQIEHPDWKFWEKKDNHKLRGTGKIEWITYKDIDGRTYYATTVNGDRTYETEEYGGKGLLNPLDNGNWSKQERDIDLYRPVDFEMLNEKLGVFGILDKHSKHAMTERALGTYQGVEKVFGKYLKMIGMNDNAQNKVIKIIAGLSTKAKLAAVKLFFVNDPKYAFWTLTHDVVGFTGKAFEQIFGISVGGSGGHGH